MTPLLAFVHLPDGVLITIRALMPDGSIWQAESWPEDARLVDAVDGRFA